MRRSKAPRADHVRLIRVEMDLQDAVKLIAAHESVSKVGTWFDGVWMARILGDAGWFEAHAKVSGLAALRKAARMWRNAETRKA